MTIFGIVEPYHGILCRMRCDVHGIGAAPDGQCVLCRREVRAQSRRRTRKLAAQGAMGLFAASAALLAGPRAARFASDLTRQPREASVRDAEPPKPVLRPPANPNARVEREPEWRHALPPRAPPPQPAPRAADSPEPPPEAAAAEIAGRPGAPTPAELRAAIDATRIVIFTTSWCLQCKRAKAFLQASGFRYQERDIERDERAARELRQRSGSMKAQIPTLEIDGKLLQSGFSRDYLLYHMARSVERRLGVDGVRFK
jgi:mycoredoxin